MADTDWVDDPPLKDDSDWVDDPSDNDKSNQVVSGVRKLVQGASGGLSDEISGLVSGAGRAAGVKGLGGPMKDISLAKDGPTTDWEVLKQAYLSERNKERSALKKDSVDYPTQSSLLEVGGAIISPVNKLMPGASFAKSGAVIGGITGLGSSEAENVGGILKDTAFGVGGGAILGKVGDKAAPYIGKAASAVGNKTNEIKQAVGAKFNDAAEKLAFKATGAMLKDFRSADDKGMVNKVGRYLLDKGIVKAGDDVEAVARKALADNISAGKALDDIYTKAGDVFKDKMNAVGFDPIRDKKEILKAAKDELGDTVGSEAALNKLGKYLDEVAAGHGDGPMHKAMAKYEKEVSEYLPKQEQFIKEKGAYQNQVGKAAEDIDQTLLPGFSDDLQRTGTETKTFMTNANYLDAEVPKITQSQGQLEFPVSPNAPTKPVAPSDIRNPMSPRRSNDIKTAMDNEINYSRNPLSKDPAIEKAFYGGRKKMLEKVEQGLDDLGGGELVDAMKKANQEYGFSKQATRMAEDRVSRESANKMFGLTDTIAGIGATGYGAATGDWKTAVAGMAAKKGIEKYGVSILASMTDKIGQRLLKDPKMQKLAIESPKIFGATVYNLVQKLEERGNIPFPKSADKEVETASVPAKGPDKWANDGAEKLKSHGLDNQEVLNKLMQSKKGKELLIKASDLKANSKAMDKIYAQIKSEYQKGGF